MENKICENCKIKFDEKEHIPINLKCSHIICLDCHKNIKVRFADDYCPICQKRNKIPFDSTKNFVNSLSPSKLTKSKSSIIKLKKFNFNKNRRFSHVINFNKKNTEKFGPNKISKISNNLPKMKKLRKMSIDLTESPLNNFKKKRKISINLSSNNFLTKKNKTKNINLKSINKLNLKKINKSYNPLISSKANNNNNCNTDSSYLESRKPSKAIPSHKASINSNILKKEESSDLSSNYINKSKNKTENSKENNNNNNIMNRFLLKEINRENCSIHMGKEIEYYCNSCSSLACGICLIDFHNGHDFGLLSDAVDKIRMSISDADNILNELLYQSNNNKKLINILFNEINALKKEQEFFVTNSFKEIMNKLNDVKDAIIDEFDNKYNLEFTRVEKLLNIFEEDINEIKKTKSIINEIFNEFELVSEVKVLKQKKNYDNFLYWCNINIKRIYSNQKKVKNEIYIHPSIKPFPINNNELIGLLNLINPKNIANPFSSDNNTINKNINSENNMSRNFFNNFTKINNNSYSYKNRIFYQNHNNKANYIEINNNIIKKNNSDDMILQNKMPINYTIEEYNKLKNELINTKANNYDNLQNNNINENYNEKRMNQLDNNIIYPYIVTKDNQTPIEQKYKTEYQSPLPLIPKSKKIYFNTEKKEEIEKFYNNMKMNNEMSIYCFTNLNGCLIYHLPSQNWKFIPYYNEISEKICYQKNSAVAHINGDRMIITGGYDVLSKEISNSVFQINIYNINDVKIIKPMKIKRHSHSCLYLSNNIYCIGGYGYNNDRSNPSTSKIISLKSCEKYDIITKEWKQIKELNSARAYFGNCIYNENIFVFGGYDNNNILSSIEKYEPITDIWITYHIKLPIKIAELGVINYNNKFIFLLGGVDENKKLLDNIYIGRLDHNIVNYSWKEGPKLICPRNTRNNCFLVNNNIYVIGGSSEGICERYSLIKQKWEMIKSYLSVVSDTKEDVKIKYLTSELSFNIQ